MPSRTVTVSPRPLLHLLAVLLILPWVLAPETAPAPPACPLPPDLESTQPCRTSIPVPPGCPLPADLRASTDAWSDGSAHDDDGSTVLARDSHLARMGVDKW